MKQKIETSQAPAAIGPYSQAIKAGDSLYLSGQIPLDPQTGEIVAADITGQTKQVLENMKAILAEADLGMDSVVKTTVLLKDMSDFTAMNEVYADYFTDTPPARMAYQVGALPKDSLVEIDAIAIIG